MAKYKWEQRHACTPLTNSDESKTTAQKKRKLRAFRAPIQLGVLLTYRGKLGSKYSSVFLNYT